MNKKNASSPLDRIMRNKSDESDSTSKKTLILIGAECEQRLNATDVLAQLLLVHLHLVYKIEQLLRGIVYDNRF